MLVKCHEDLHPLVKLMMNSADQIHFFQDCSLDIFEQITSKSELVERTCQKGAFDFQEVLKTSNVFFNGAKNMN
jgi:hypothetical protein